MVDRDLVHKPVLKSPFLSHTVLAFGAWLLLSFSPVTAFAHLMPTGHGTINITGKKAYIIISVSAASFDLKETRGAGLLNADELKINGDQIREQIREGLFIGTQKSRATFEKILLNLPESGQIETEIHGHNRQTNTDLTIMIVAQFEAPPDSLFLRSKIWASAKDSIKFKTKVSEGEKILRSELGTISMSRPEYVFFADSKYVALSSFSSGFEHFILGWDHLLFFVLLLIASITFKRWAIVGLCFTCAYAGAFSAISLGWLSFPLWSVVSEFIVESVILLSLLVVSIPNLIRVRPSLFCEGIVVGVLGIVHGLGFASAMSGAQSFDHLVELKIFGFVGGVFVAQFLVAFGLWAVSRIVTAMQNS